MSGSTLLVLIVFTVIEIAVVLVVAGSVFVLSRRALRFGEHAICIGSSIFRKEFPHQGLAVVDAKVIDPGDETYRRTVRLAGGFGALGVEVGWFSLANGTDAYVHLWRQTNAVYIPMENQKALILGVPNPEDVLAALKSKQS